MVNKLMTLRCNLARRFVWAMGLAMALGGSSFGEPGDAGKERSYVMRDGRKIRMTQSASEYGVVLRHCAESGACARRLADAGVGTLEDFKHAPTARAKLLTLSQTKAKRRADIQADPSVTEVRPIYRFEGVSTPAVGTGTSVAKVRGGLSAEQREQLWRDHGVVAVEPVQGQPDVFLLRPADEDGGEVDMAEALAGDPRVLWSQPNLRRPTVRHQVVPSDPFYSRQWHLNNTGQRGGTVDVDIDAPEAWEITTGEGVRFGIYDTGCDVDHEDLRENYIGFGQDATLEPGTEGADDPRPKVVNDNHATSVMGLAVGRGNALGGRGVAFDAEFTATRGLEDVTSDLEIARAFNFAREQNVDVHINSWSFFPGIPNAEVIVDIIQLAFHEGRNKGDLDGDGDDDPLGMVILFAAGNEGLQIEPGFHLSGVPEVIGVGATNDLDVLAVYSNYGTTVDIMAPSNDFARPGIFTTDNTDTLIDPGINDGGVVVGSDVRDADTEGKYTQFFGGTSAACPIAAGVAGLVLSVNPMLTATDVRLILEHTTDKVTPEDADYHGITNRSLFYGYGRINAGGGGDNKIGAVEAAQQTLTNGGFTWPDRAANVRVEGNFLRWKQNIGTTEFLALSNRTPFDFIPEDGACYDSRQANCGSDVQGLPGGAQVIGVGCGLSCDASVPGGCATGAEQCASFTAPNIGEQVYLAIYARNEIGRYSYGVAAQSNGDIVDSGVVVGEDDSGGATGGTPPPPGPAVSISVSPLEGVSPLRVSFSGNAVSTVPIDEGRTIWDFNTDDANPVDDTSRTATHTYVVEAGAVRTFVARLTMYDTNGNAGYAEVAIRVEGPEMGDDDAPIGTSDIRIIVGLPGTSGSDEDVGTSPFSVVLSVDATNLPGTLQSVVWDLGDGSRANSLTVTHTYENDTEAALRIPITATVTTVTSGATTVSSAATRIITVNPGIPVIDPGDPDLPGTHPGGAGGSATPCGAAGMIPVVLMFIGLACLRRRT